MSTTRYQPGVPFCPLCGGPMEARPNLDGDGWLALCPKCPNAPLIPLRAPPPPDPLERDKATARFKKLTQPFTPPRPGGWPEALLEDLPQEARELLLRRPPSPGVQGTAQLREDMAKALRDQGYVLSEDARGLRISGAPVQRGRSTSQLSVSDVIRMASDLGGGALPAEKRTHCPKCDAVVSTDAGRCPWCGQTIPPPGG
jgi:ssDNA-binding Zn-finger/Zn-ribbon topoisomerase 1